MRYTKRKQDFSDFPKRVAVNTVVLAFPYFHSGRHFWEGEVGDRPKWAVVVCEDPPSTALRRSLSACQGHWPTRWQGKGCAALGAGTVPVMSEVKPWTMAGEISFYNTTDKPHIYTFPDTFNRPLRPYFYMGPDSKPLRVSTGADRE